MTRRALTSFFAAAAVACAVPLLAQDSKGTQGQSRPNTGGGSSGSAVSRPSGGSGGSSGSGSASSGSSSGSGGSSSASAPSSSPGEFRAPSRPERRNEPRAVPRSPASDSQQRRVAPGGANASSGSNGDDGDRRRAVPVYARPRDGRTPVGSAVPRTGRPPNRTGSGGGYYYDPYSRYGYYSNRYPYGYYWPGYGFGMGYFYDPWMWGYYSPYSYGGYYDPYYSYGGGGGYGGGYRRGQYRDTGSLRLKVKPEHGQVYVDGYYIGEVDSFDGVFQRMPIEAGAHRVEIRADGYESAQFEIMVVAGQTVTYKGELKRR